MGLRGDGTLVKVGKGRTRYIVVPADVAGDSTFPFQDKERLDVVIDGNRVIISKKKK
jgi:hypothetical protein